MVFIPLRRRYNNEVITVENGQMALVKQLVRVRERDSRGPVYGANTFRKTETCFELVFFLLLLSLYFFSGCIIRACLTVGGGACLPTFVSKVYDSVIGVRCWQAPVT